MRVILSVLIIIFVFKKAVCFRDTDYGTSSLPDVCKPGPKGRVPWIIHNRDSDYGWGENTHRANIALAVNDYNGDGDEMRKMALQLEVELTRALFRNNISPIDDSDLALYIHALLATKNNPRDFHGTDLVEDLLRRIETATGHVNPFLVLAVCNAHAVKYKHLNSHLVDLAKSKDGHQCQPNLDSREVQLKALALKAFACAADINMQLRKFTGEMERIAQCLKVKYDTADGSFGSVYTTSLAVQALTASKDFLDLRWWDERKSRAFLERESEIDINLVKAYYIEMGLNSEKYKFIKDLYDGVPQPRSVPTQPDMHYVTYTVRTSYSPDMYLSATLKVAKGTNFYEIMRIASSVDPRFNFANYLNKDGYPVVYSVSGIPNDVEENKFWRLCRQMADDRQPIIPFDESPALLLPEKDEHLMYWYINTDCPAK